MSNRPFFFVCLTHLDPEETLCNPASRLSKSEELPSENKNRLPLGPAFLRSRRHHYFLHCPTVQLRDQPPSARRQSGGQCHIPMPRNKLNWWGGLIHANCKKCGYRYILQWEAWSVSGQILVIDSMYCTTFKHTPLVNRLFGVYFVSKLFSIGQVCHSNSVPPLFCPGLAVTFTHQPLVWCSHVQLLGTRQI